MTKLWNLDKHTGWTEIEQTISMRKRIKVEEKRPSVRQLTVYLNLWRTKHSQSLSLEITEIISWDLIFYIVITRVGPLNRENLHTFFSVLVSLTRCPDWRSLSFHYVSVFDLLKKTVVSGSFIIIPWILNKVEQEKWEMHYLYSSLFFM